MTLADDIAWWMRRTGSFEAAHAFRTEHHVVEVRPASLGLLASFRGQAGLNATDAPSEGASLA